MNFIWSWQFTRATLEDVFERRQVFAVDDQQLVLVELHFQRNARIEHRDARAAVVEHQVLVIVEVLLRTGISICSRYRSTWPRCGDCDSSPGPRRPRGQRLEQIHEHLEQRLVRGGAHQHRHAGPVLFVAIHVVPIALRWERPAVVARANGIGQDEVAVADDAQVGFELFFGEALETAGAGRGLPSRNTLRKKRFKKPMDSAILMADSGCG